MAIKFKTGTDRIDHIFGADGDDWYIDGLGGDDFLYGSTATTFS